MNALQKTVKLEVGNGAVVELTQHEAKIMEALNNYNQLRGQFKLTIVDALEYKDSLLRIVPDLPAGALRLAIDGMMDGRLEYDRDLGVQNIFRALQYVATTPEGYKILPKIH